MTNKLPWRKRCLIVSDLDGTLLNSESKISQTTCDAVQQLINMGHKFCIATGRPLRGSIDFYKQLKLDTPICNYNGAAISRPLDNSFGPIKLTFHRKIIIGMLKDKKINSMLKNAVIESASGSFLWKRDSADEEINSMLQHFHIISKNRIQYIEPDFSNFTDNVYCVLFALKDTNQDKVNDFVYYLKHYISTMILRNWSIPFLGTVLEINSQFATKAMALKYLSCFYAIPLERCYAFGDADNDAEMLQLAGSGYAMHNGTQTAKLFARYLTKYDNDHDGVAYELSRIFKFED